MPTDKQPNIYANHIRLRSCLSAGAHAEEEDFFAGEEEFYADHFDFFGGDFEGDFGSGEFEEFFQQFERSLEERRAAAAKRRQENVRRGFDPRDRPALPVPAKTSRKAKRPTSDVPKADLLPFASTWGGQCLLTRCAVRHTKVEEILEQRAFGV